MNNNELQFILRMRDEASQVLKSLSSSFGSSATAAKGLGEAGDKASVSLAQVVKNAKEAATAVTSLWTANAAAQQALAVFRDYEKGMQVVTRTTQIAGAEMTAFQAKFDAMAARTKGVSTHALVEFAEVAGQLGIRGSSDVLNFSETIGKLTTVTNIAGEQGAKQFGRLLLLTGEGAQATGKLANSLAGLSATTKASGSEILAMGAALAQSTANFKMGSAALTGLGAAAAQLNFQPDLFANAAGRTLRELRDAALNATGGMRDLSTMLGISREDFLKLIETSPDQALLKFMNALKQLQSSGQSVTGFLQKFNLQGDEAQKVLLTLAKNVEEVASKIQESKNLQLGGGALDKSFAEYAKTTDATLKGLSTSWELFEKNIGKGLAPAVNSVASSFKAILDSANAMFSAMPDMGGKVLAWAVIGIPALKGLQSVMSLFPGVLATVNGALAMTGLQFGKTAAQAGAAAGAVGAAQGTMGAAAGGGIGGKVMKGLGIASLFVAAHEVGKFAGEKIADGMITYTPNAARRFGEWYGRVFGEAKKEAAKEAAKDDHGAGAAHGPAPGTPALGPVKTVFSLAPEQKQVLEQFDQVTKLQEDIKKAEAAIGALRRGSVGMVAGEGDAKSEAEIARIQGLIELKKRALDPVQDQVRLLGLEQQKAAAVTQEEKNHVEVLDAIRAMREKLGALTAKEVADIQTATKALQETRKAAAMVSENHTLDQQLEMARAVTQTEKDRVAIAQQLANWQRQNGVLSAAELETMREKLTLAKQIQTWQAQADSLNPQGKALRDYNEQLSTLQQRLKAGVITQSEFSREATKLHFDTLSARSPMGAIAQQQKEEIAGLKIVGEYRDADRKTLQQIIELQKQGLTVNAQMAQAMGEYNRAIQDAQKAQSSGLTGWANQIGSLKDNMMDLTKDFASGLSSAISGALQGQKGSFSSFLRQMGTKMMDVGINQLMKQAMGGAGLLNGGQAELARAQAAQQSLSGLAADQAKTMTIATAQMQAATVNLTGASITGLPGAAGIPGLPGNDNGLLTGGIGAAGSTGVSGVAAAAGGAAPGGIGSMGGLGNLGSLGSIFGAGGGFSVPGLDSMGGLGGVGSMGLGLLGLLLGGRGGKSSTSTTSTTTQWLQQGQQTFKSIGSGQDAFQKLTPLSNATVASTGLPVNPPLPPVRPAFNDNPYGGLRGTISTGTEAIKSSGGLRGTITAGTEAVKSSGGLMPTVGAGGKPLGFLSSRYEGKVGTIGDFGQAYGKYQFDATQGGLQTFLKDNPQYAQQFAGLTPKTSAFNAKWKEIARNDPQGFAAAQDKSATNIWYKPNAAAAQKMGFKMDDPGMQEAVFSGSIQHGRFRSGILDPVSRQAGFRDMSAQDQIKALYSRRQDYALRATDSKYHRGLVDRYTQERKDALELSRTGRGGEGGAPAFRNAMPDQAKQMTQQATTQIKQMGNEVQSGFKQMGQSASQMGQQLQTVTPQMQSLGQNLTNIGQTATQAVPGMTQLAPGIGQVGQQAMGAVPQLGQFGSSFGQMMQSMMSSIGGMGGGGGGGLGGIFGLLGGLFHEGGVVGAGAPASGYRVVSPTTWVGAPRLHSGGGKGLGADEYPAILQRGERVLTSNDNARTNNVISGLARQAQGQAGGARQSQAVRNQSVTFNITTPNADSFRKSQPQLQSEATVKMQRAGRYA